MYKENITDLNQVKIINQEKDIKNLADDLEEENKTYAILKDKLEQKSTITGELSIERNDIFNKLEKEKYDINNKIINIQEQYTEVENKADMKINEWVSNYNNKEAELENNKIE
jgi:hypothetical protein